MIEVADRHGDHVNFRAFQLFAEGKLRQLLSPPGDDELSDLHRHDVGEDAEGDPRDHRRADKDDRHERRHPEGVGLDGAEDKTGIAVEEACHRDADAGQDLHRLFIQHQGLLAQVVGPEGEQPVEAVPDVFRQSPAGLVAQSQGGFHEMPAVDKPQLRGDDHPIDGKDDAKGGNGRGEVGGEHHLDAPERLLQMQEERQERHRQERKGKDQGKAGDVLQLFHAEDVVEGGEDKGPGHQAGHERVHDDLDGPVDVLIGIDEELLDSPDFPMHHGYLTSLESPR